MVSRLAGLVVRTSVQLKCWGVSGILDNMRTLWEEVHILLAPGGDLDYNDQQDLDYMNAALGSIAGTVDSDESSLRVSHYKQVGPL